ncbi:type III secretion system cytoplasmic ring protein SctQ [Caenimonas sp. SL110]|uniref:type III secretion system cytoplasmic ring protein SctQ n=1 Tax=Caenimonas sp. SL110 TaxID=1450524 RepID=UPI000654A61B|nr:type III secretion system cytoplasmic ring protein SctQ [Caenimonas sp. SL110]
MTQAPLSRPLRLPTISRDTLSSRNVLCRRRAPMEAFWLDDDWMFDIRASRPNAPSDRFVECDWGGARVFIGIAHASLDMLANLSMPGTSPAQWPLAVLLAALECTASGLASVVENATRKSLRIVSVDARPARLDLEACEWRAWSRDHELAGELLLDATASRFLATELRDQPAIANEDDWKELPVRLSLVAGWVDLSASALRSVALHDVVLLDECLLSQDNRLMVLVGPRLGVLCSLAGNELEVLQGVREMMADVDDSVAASSGLIDDVPVRLTFDLGEREISLGDLRSLQPGYLFNLGRDPKSTVSIRANGRLIGNGELVDIEGRVGVSVLNFSLEAK